MKDKEDDPSPLHVTLFQEVERYNVLLENMLSTLKLLKKGIKGLVVMSADLDAIFDALANNKVPALYLKAYPSLKPLGSWTRDLTARLEQIRGWISGTYPGVYWLAGFTYLRASSPRFCRRQRGRIRIPIDTLGFEYQVMTQEEKDLAKEPPDEGVYVKDMYLEGAGWDMDALCLCEPNPMELVVDMPIVHFRPAETKAGGDGKKEKKKEKKQGTYQCPPVHVPRAHGLARATVVHDHGGSEIRRGRFRFLDQERHGVALEPRDVKASSVRRKNKEKEEARNTVGGWRRPRVNSERASSQKR